MTGIFPIWAKTCWSRRCSGARERDVHLPAGMWRDFWSGMMVPGGGTLACRGRLAAVPAPLQRIPVFERIRHRAAHRAKQEVSGLSLLRRQRAHGLQP